jgi:hypothetical protein
MRFCEIGFKDRHLSGEGDGLSRLPLTSNVFSDSARCNDTGLTGFSRLAALSVEGSCAVMPPPDASGQPVRLADSFDVPVIVRRGSPLRPERRLRQSWIDHADMPWPSNRDVPSPGWYLIPTTWRDVIDAAMTVGRDPFAWLAAVPALAWAEITARRSPLRAYLQRARNAAGVAALTGYSLEPNVVYLEGTEKTARALFAYRIGMTMAEWACRGLLGLGATVHAEAIRPPGAGPEWSPANGLPDLVGLHWSQPATWIVEAKGGRRTGLRELAKGARQLSTVGLMTGPHARVLCGTSIEHRVFMTIDVEKSGGAAGADMHVEHRRLSPGENDDELIALARSRMLNYYTLQALPREALSVRPVGSAVEDVRRRDSRPVDLVYPLESDESTREERTLARSPAAYARRPPSQRLDMLVGRVPGTDLVIGMSRRLYATCRSLAVRDAEIMRTVHEDFPDTEEQRQRRGFDEDAIEEFLVLRRETFAERVADFRDDLRETARRAYAAGGENSWQQLLRAQPQLDAESPAGLLESATPDTYLGIDTSTAAPAQ